MIDEKNILYRPDIAPDLRYDSRKSPDDHNLFDTVEEPGKTPLYDPIEISNDLYELSEILQLPAIPEGIRPLGKTLEKLAMRIAIAFPEGNPIFEREPEIQTVTTEKLDDDRTSPKVEIINGEAVVIPAIFSEIPTITMNFEKPRTLVEIVQDDYEQDELQLNAYYAQKLQSCLQKYFQQMITIKMECNLDSIDDLLRTFEGEQVGELADPDLKHLKDFITRSQIGREQTINLLNKTHSVDNTMLHLRSWHVAAKQRERYYEENYGDSETFLDSHSNTILRESRSEYDSKYREAYYSMYKYLESSATLTNEVLESQTKEAQAKGKLLEAGVNVFATAGVDSDITAAISAGAKDAVSPELYNTSNFGVATMNDSSMTATGVQTATTAPTATSQSSVTNDSINIQQFSTPGIVG